MSSVASNTVAVVPNNNSVLLTTTQSDHQQSQNRNSDHESNDERQQLNKQQTTNRPYLRGNSNKSKQLTRSHAMKESASPPRTPTAPHSPISDTMKSLSPLIPEENNSNNNNIQSQSSSHHSPCSSTTSSTSAAAAMLTPTFVLPQATDDNNSANGKSQLDIEFPKLTPPKQKIWNTTSPTNNTLNQSKSNNNINNNSNSSNSGCGGSSAKNLSNYSSASGTNNSDSSNNNNSTSNLVSEDNYNESQSASQGGAAAVAATGDNKRSSSSTSSSSGSQQPNVTQSASTPNIQNSISSTSSTSTLINCDINNDSNNNTKISIDTTQSHDDTQMTSKSPNFISNNNTSSDSNNNNNKLSSSSNSTHHTTTVKTKPPLKQMSSSSSVEGGGTSSGFISRDSSSEQFTDQSGIDLVQFFKETLNKNAKDRNMLMKIERDLMSLATDNSRNGFIKFPPMSSYNRMLIHRTAAYFGMDHNVDASQQSVICTVTKETRIPDIRFKTLIRDTFTEEPRKSILKREAHSFEDYRQGGLLSVRGILNRKAKSFEEREEEYEKAKRRIFRNSRELYTQESMDEQEWAWIHQQPHSEREHMPKLKISGSRLLKIQSSSMDSRYDKNPSMSKSHSFGGSGGGSHSSLMRDDSITSTKSAGPRLLKQDSTNSTTWRLSPSSSGNYSRYKTQSSMRSESITPSPTGGYGSGDHTPEPSQAQSPETPRGVVWAVTDMASVPKGSVLIDPVTLRPIVNQDGSIYHFDPSNPPSTAAATTKFSSRKKLDKQRSLNKSSNNLDSDRENADNNDSVEFAPPQIIKTQQQQQQQIDYGNDDDRSTISSNASASMGSTNISIDKDCYAKENANDKASQNELNVSNHLKPEEMMSPKQKHQATSPNLPLSETVIAEDEESVTPTSVMNPIVEEEPIVASSPDESKNDSNSPIIQEQPPRYQPGNQYSNAPLPIMSYAQTTFQPQIDGSGTTVYNSSIPTYQQGPDGTLYVLSQPLMYSYATSENEMSSYIVPVYDQNAMQGRDPNMTTTVLPMYQPAPTAAYNGTTLYQSPVVYSTEQFPSAGPPVAQYPMSYPVSYTYPINGTPYQNYWPQPVATYLIPQTQLSSTPTPGAAQTPVLLPPQTPQTPHSSSASAHTSTNSGPSYSTAGGGGTKRNSPPTSHSAPVQTTVPLQSFPQSVPLPLAPPAPTQSSGSAEQSGTMYAVPPSMYPNMLPYPTSAGAPTGFYQPMPASQGNPTAIISQTAVIPHPHPHHHPHSIHAHHHQHSAGQSIGNTTHSQTYAYPGTELQCGVINGIASLSFNSNPNNNSAPQSAPSTPLSLTNKNPPLFATPPIQLTSQNQESNVVSYEKPKSQSNMTKRTNGNVPVVHQMQKNSNQRGPPSHLVNGNMSSKKNHNDNERGGMKSNGNHYNSGPRQDNNNYQKNYHHSKMQNSPNGNGMTHHQQQQQHQQSNQHQRIPPMNLDLKRNSALVSHNSRSTPSTNSAESNNSPNSITSYNDHNNRNNNNNNNNSNYSGSSGSSYHGHSNYHRSNSSTVVSNSNYHGNNNNNSGAEPSTPTTIQTCFPFNVHPQAAPPTGVNSNATHLLDHQPLIGAYNPAAMAAGMYVKFAGQAFGFTNPSIALQNNRKSPSSDIRPPLTQLTAAGVYSMNMMLPGQRQLTPRTVHNNPNYKGNRAQR